MVIIGKAKRPDLSTHALGVVRNGLYAHPSPTNNSVAPGSYLRHTNADASSGYKDYSSPKFRDREVQKFTPSYMLPPSPTPGSIGSKKSYNAKASDYHIARNAWASVSMTSPRALHSPRHALKSEHMSTPSNPVSPSHQRRGRSASLRSSQCSEVESKGGEDPEYFTFSKRDVRKSYSRPTYDKPTASALERTRGKVQMPFKVKTKKKLAPKLRIQVPQEHSAAAQLIRVPSPKEPVRRASVSSRQEEEESVEEIQTNTHGEAFQDEFPHQEPEAHKEVHRRKEVRHSKRSSAAPQQERYQHRDVKQPDYQHHIAKQAENQHRDVKQPEYQHHDVKQPEYQHHDVKQPDISLGEREIIKKELLRDLLKELKSSEQKPVISLQESLFGKQSSSNSQSKEDFFGATSTLGHIGQMETKRDILIRQLWERERNKQVMEDRLERERREQVKQRRLQERERLELLLQLEHERITKSIQRAEEIETLLINLAQAEANEMSIADMTQKYSFDRNVPEPTTNPDLIGTNNDDVVRNLDRQCDYLYHEIQQVDTRLKGMAHGPWNMPNSSKSGRAYEPVYSLDQAVDDISR